MNVISKPQLSLWETLHLAFKLLIISPPRLARNCAQHLYFAASRGLSLGYYFTCAKTRLWFSFGGRHLQNLLPTCDESYQTWLRQKQGTTKDPVLLDRLVPDIQAVPGRQANILWLGSRKTARKVVLFMHGGGYVLPIIPAYLDWCWNAYVLPSVRPEAASPNGDAPLPPPPPPPPEIAVAVLQYSLAPTHQFPAQLGDVAAALPVIFDSGFRPSDIVIGGDSAGGNLTVLLWHHLLRPHPQIPAVHIDEPFAASFVVSPWLSVRFDTPSYKRNEGHDMLSMSIMKSIVGEYLGEYLIRHGGNGDHSNGHGAGDDDGWSTNPIGVEECWLQDLARVTPKLYITAGEEEILLDNALELAEKLKKVQTTVDVVLEVNAGQAHDWIIVEAMNGHIGTMTERMREWTSKLFQ